MLKTGITIGCAVAMLTAVGFAVALRHTRRTPTPLKGDEPFRERLAVTVGRSAGMLLGAVVSGVLTIGAGGRLMMRIMAATSGDDAQGRLTDADELVGRVNLGGSLFLILGFGVAAAIGGLALFATLRRWLPDRSLIAGLIGASIGAGLLVRPSGLISADNEDFTLLDPVPLAVALCLAMIVAFGASFGVLVDTLAAKWPRPGWSVKGVASLLPFLLLLPSPPLLVGFVIVVLMGTALTSNPAVVSRAADEDGWVDGVTRLGRIVVGLAGGLGALSVIAAAGQVLTI